MAEKPYLFEKILNDQPIAAGAEIGAMISVRGFSKVIVMAKGEAAFDVYSYQSPDGSSVFTSAKETLLTGITANNGDVKEVAKLAPNLYVTVKNTSAGTSKFDLWVYGL